MQPSIFEKKNPFERSKTLLNEDNGDVFTYKPSYLAYKKNQIAAKDQLSHVTMNLNDKLAKLRN